MRISVSPLRPWRMISWPAVARRVRNEMGKAFQRYGVVIADG